MCIVKNIKKDAISASVVAFFLYFAVSGLLNVDISLPVLGLFMIATGSISAVISYFARMDNIKREEKDLISQCKNIRLH